MLQLNYCPIFALIMNNTRFATAIHILTLLATYPEEWLSSDYIAGSININPVVVRKELLVLNKAGLIISKKGKEGGVQLAKPGNQILLSDIYNAVKNTEVLGKRNQHTNPKCPIGKQINNKLKDLYLETDMLLYNALAQKTLAGFCRTFK